MAKPVTKKPIASKNQPVVKTAPKTLQERVEKWFLPVVFVAISGVFIWAIAREVFSVGK